MVNLDKNKKIYYDYNNFLGLQSVAAEGEEREERNKRIRIIHDRLKNRSGGVVSMMWLGIYSIFTTIERDDKLNEEESAEVDDIIKTVLKDAHHVFNTETSWSNARIFRDR